MDVPQNLRCARCGGFTSEELTVPQYSDVASRLLCTNEPPRSLEAAFIRGEIKHGHVMLVSIDKDIATLQAMLNDLQEKRNSLEQFVDDHVAILSPIRRLPPEVLTEIFNFVGPMITTNTEEGIWPFGRVCSYWRSVLLSSPSLWSNIHLGWDILRWGDEVGHQVSIVEEILSHSGNLPLNITLTGRFDVTAEQAFSVILTIIAASPRWHHISLCSIPDSVLPLLFQLRGHLPMLVELDYQGRTFPEWVEGAPLLRKLEVKSSFYPLSLSLNLPNLRECDIDPLSFYEEQQFLHQCPNLQTYTFRSRQQTEDPLSSDMLRMSKLHTVTFCSYHNTASIDYLILPCLDDVFVTVADANPTLIQGFVSSLMNLLSRSQCFPTKLKITSFDGITIQLIPEVAFQNLTKLEVTCFITCLLQTVVPALTLQHKSSVTVLPQLEKLHLHPLHLYDYPSAAQDMVLLIDMVKSRWHAHEYVGTMSRLAVLELKSISGAGLHPPSQFRGTLAPLLAFRAEGLEMDIDSFYLEKVEEECAYVCSNRGMQTSELEIQEGL